MDIFDQIDELAKTEKYQKGAEVTAKLMLYNSKHKDELLTIEKISDQTGFSEEIIKKILAGIHDDLSDYYKVQDFIENYKVNSNSSIKYVDKVNTDNSMINLNYNVSVDPINFETIPCKIETLRVNNYLRKKVSGIGQSRVRKYSNLIRNQSNSREAQTISNLKKFRELELGVIYG